VFVIKQLKPPCLLVLADLDVCWWETTWLEFWFYFIIIIWFACNLIFTLEVLFLCGQVFNIACMQ